MKFWQHKVVNAPGKFCILEATDYQMRQKISQVLVDPQTKIEGGLDIGTLGDGKIHVIKDPESNGLILNMHELADQLQTAAKEIQKSIKKNRLWAGNFDKVELEDDESEPENTRYELSSGTC